MFHSLDTNFIAFITTISCKKTWKLRVITRVLSTTAELWNPSVLMSDISSLYHVWFITLYLVHHLFLLHSSFQQLQYCIHGCPLGFFDLESQNRLALSQQLSRSLSFDHLWQLAKGIRQVLALFTSSRVASPDATFRFSYCFHKKKKREKWVKVDCEIRKKIYRHIWKYNWIRSTINSHFARNSASVNPSSFQYCFIV